MKKTNNKWFFHQNFTKNLDEYFLLNKNDLIITNKNR